jgi:glycosyltransferase involved in cell wall biosynthesis
VRKYGLRESPRLLPTPVEIPGNVDKSAQPTVVFNARLDRRKRPECYLALARAFPEVRFILIGKARSAGYEASLREEAARSPNVEWVGFVDQFSSDRLSEILSGSWILVNTATREGLPNAFLEAAAHRCAILSGVDPDGFASRFGHHAADDDFERGLRMLLQGDTWRKKGEAGYRHVLGTFATDRALECHLDAYDRLLERRGSATTVRSLTQAAHGAEQMTSPGASP